MVSALKFLHYFSHMWHLETIFSMYLYFSHMWHLETIFSMYLYFSHMWHWETIFSMYLYFSHMWHWETIFSMYLYFSHMWHLETIFSMYLYFSHMWHLETIFSMYLYFSHMWHLETIFSMYLYFSHMWHLETIFSMYLYFSHMWHLETIFSMYLYFSHMWHLETIFSMYLYALIEYTADFTLILHISILTLPWWIFRRIYGRSVLNINKHNLAYLILFSNDICSLIDQCCYIVGYISCFFSDHYCITCCERICYFSFLLMWSLIGSNILLFTLTIWCILMLISFSLCLSFSDRCDRALTITMSFPGLYVRGHILVISAVNVTSWQVIYAASFYEFVLVGSSHFLWQISPDIYILEFLHPYTTTSSYLSMLTHLVSAGVSAFDANTISSLPVPMLPFDQ